MKRLVLALGALVLLAGCSTEQLKAVGADTTAAVQDVATVCKSAPALIGAVASTAPDPTSAAGIILADAQASCTADGAIAATLAPKVDTSTPAWLQNLLQELQQVAQVAGLVVPLI